MVEQTDDRHIFFQTCKITQTPRNEDASLRVELYIGSIGEVVSLDAARLFAVAEAAQARFERRPLRIG